MKKKQFRIRLFDGANKLAEMVVLEAAKNNARSENSSMPLLYAFAWTLKTVGRDDETQVEQIGEYTLHIDVKVNGNYETVCIIEEIEIWEVVNDIEDEEATAILSGTTN
jgi:hypothetical protein